MFADAHISSLGYLQTNFKMLLENSVMTGYQFHKPKENKSQFSNKSVENKHKTNIAFTLVITASKVLTIILTSELISLLQANSEIAKQFQNNKHVDPYLQLADIAEISQNYHLLFRCFLIPSFFLLYFMVQKFGVLMAKIISPRGREMKQKKLIHIFGNKRQV